MAWINPPPPRSLEELRSAIDGVDSKLLALLNERAALAQEVAHAKAQVGNHQILRPEREAEILRRVAGSAGAMPAERLVAVFREVISACRSLEAPMRVAYLGPEGTFTQMAARKHFGSAVELLPASTIAEVFRQVDGGAADYGVVPVENSTEGSVNQTLDLLLDYPLSVCGEVQLRVVHNLVSSGAPLEGLRRLHVHYQTRAQCKAWLGENARHLELVDVPSNGEAARRAAADPEAGAVSTAVAAELNGLTILQAGIEDDPENTTRFLVIATPSHAVGASGADKTSLAVSGPNRPGSLYQILKPLAEAGVSLTRIESRPARVALWEYVFYLDLEGHQSDPSVAAALTRIKESCQFFKNMGSYPKAVL